MIYCLLLLPLFVCVYACACVGGVILFLASFVVLHLYR